LMELSRLGHLSSPYGNQDKEITATSRYGMQCSRVFNALKIQFGPSKYTSLKTTLQNAIPN
jgi:hypothetical protein